MQEQTSSGQENINILWIGRPHFKDVLNQGCSHYQSRRYMNANTGPEKLKYLIQLTEMEIFLFICFHFWNILSHDVIKVHIVCVLKTQDSFSNTVTKTFLRYEEQSLF